jgi:ABC-type antimicrobial peptide transport system permease subunit
MNLWTLALRSLRFHWRSHFGVLLGATLGVAILVGALAVGDSVRYSLKQIALSRLGKAHLALLGQSRFFREILAEQVEKEIDAPVVPLIMMRGTATAEEATGKGALRAGHIQVMGITPKFWQLGTSGTAPQLDKQEGVVINEYLARQLSAKVGTELLLRVDKPSLLSRDAPLSTVEDTTVAFRLPVLAIVDDSQLGRFSLEANQLPPLNLFLPLSYLQEKIGMKGRINALLTGNGRKKEIGASDAMNALWKHWRLTDAGLNVRANTTTQQTEVITDRVFLDPPIAEAALRSVPGAQGILTYFVNEIRKGVRFTPYSTVTAIDTPIVPPDMREDEVILNQWLADDLLAVPGDRVTLKYYIVGPMRKLEERSKEFRVRAVVPIQGYTADKNLMPFIPGLSDKKNCRDWEPGIPIDLTLIRNKDQAYWDKYQGTPKAYISLKSGQSLWDNRFGNLTSVRYPYGMKTTEGVEACIQQALNPASLGVFFLPVKEGGLQASTNALDFGLLFIGFSLFLIVSSLLLTALLFAFGVEQRTEETGLLLAVGLSVRRVQSLLLREGILIALFASILGGFLGIYYTKIIVNGLATIWQGAVIRSTLTYHTETQTLAIGGFSGFFVALIAIWLVVRKQAKRPARELLALGAESSALGIRKPRLAKGIALFCLAVALLMVGVGLLGSPTQSAEKFFGAGALLLIGGLAFARLQLSKMEQQANNTLTLRQLGARNNARRWGRSLNVIGLLAVGVFLVIGVGANRHNPQEDAHIRESGTGGFSLLGTSTLPIYQDLNTKEGQETYRITPEEMDGVSLLSFRLKEGDDASCLNLNRAQSPRVLGVDSAAIGKYLPFQFAQIEGNFKPADVWKSLDATSVENTIPVIGDTNTITWALGKSLGATIPYMDEHGVTQKLKVVGVLGNNVLQGNLLMSERNFNRLFPSISGYRVFLLDAPKKTPQQVEEIRRNLTKKIEDAGLELIPTPQRLTEFNMVEDTYLSIFAALGGLGVLLGSAGLGVVVLRNVLERRSELAVMRAMGFRTTTLRKMLLHEHLYLLLWGLFIGVFSALIAVFPSIRSAGNQIPWSTLISTTIGVFVNGLLWTALATTYATRLPLLRALRNE